MIPCISNIAWQPEDDRLAYERLGELNLPAIEVAPGRIWQDLASANEDDAQREAEFMSQRGFVLGAFQALLFGKPELLVFGPDGGAACLAWLGHLCRLAGAAGVQALVFGSPKNRRRGDLTVEQATENGADFFKRLGDLAADHGTIVCLEPNPVAYGCDFMETIDRAAAMVERVDSPGLALNVDMGELILNGADVRRAIQDYIHLAGHFHASEPNLEPFTTHPEAHATAAETLRQCGYEGLVSLEMKTPAGGWDVVEESLRAMADVYFPA